MRYVRFRTHGAVGPYGTRQELPLDEFMLEVPSLIQFRRIPSHPVLNSFLLEGESDAGMSGGCKWVPFEVTREEHAEAVESLLTSPSEAAKGLQFEPVPDSVCSKLEWHAWVLFVEAGVPFDEHLRLLKVERELLKKQEAASDEAHARWYAAAMRLSDFVNPYLVRLRDSANNGFNRTPESSGPAKPGKFGGGAG